MTLETSCYRKTADLSQFVTPVLGVLGAHAAGVCNMLCTVLGVC
jgi:hypothetical protein